MGKTLGNNLKHQSKPSTMLLGHEEFLERHTIFVMSNFKVLLLGPYCLTQYQTIKFCTIIGPRGVKLKCARD